MNSPSVDLTLLTVLNQVIAELADPANQFMVSANYYDHLTQGREGERWYIAQIWLADESAQQVEVTDQGLVCEVRLNRYDLTQVSRVLLPFDQIWAINRLAGPRGADPKLYYRRDKLQLHRPNEMDK